jgi:hypothetical protein
MALAERGLAVTFGMPTTHETLMVQEELQQAQIRSAKRAAQREAGAQPQIDVLHLSMAVSGAGSTIAAKFGRADVGSIASFQAIEPMVATAAQLTIGTKD